jgi:CRISPR system Cascade subunit CasD
MRALILVLEGPLLSFGKEIVDARGIVDDFPAASMITGLFGNALGWRRPEKDRLDALQRRVRFVARIDREGDRLIDFQTAQIAKNDQGWTTRGQPEGRDGGAATYQSPHIRYRHFDADKRVTVAIRLDPEPEAPTIDDLAAALQNPARPLFLGRKPFLPTRPIFEAIVEAGTLLSAMPPLRWDARAMISDVALIIEDGERRMISDLRNWKTDRHGGQRPVVICRLPGISA